MIRNFLLIGIVSIVSFLVGNFLPKIFDETVKGTCYGGDGRKANDLFDSRGVIHITMQQNTDENIKPNLTVSSDYNQIDNYPTTQSIFRFANKNNRSFSEQVMRMLENKELNVNDLLVKNNGGYSIVTAILRIKDEHAQALFNKLLDLGLIINFSDMNLDLAKQTPAVFDTLSGLGLDPYVKNNDGTTLLNSALSVGNYKLANHLVSIGVGFERYSVSSQSYDENISESTAVIYDLLQNKSLSPSDTKKTVSFLLKNGFYNKVEVADAINNLYEIELIKVHDKFESIKAKLVLW